MSAPRGLVGEFETADRLVGATADLAGAGLRRIETFTPYPLDEIEEILPAPGWPLPVTIFLAGLFGLVLSLVVQWWGAALDYPLNVGGRPLASWPAFLPTAFEITVVAAVTGGFLGLVLACRLPKLDARVAEVPRFERASRDLFFVLVDAADPRYDERRARWLLERAGARRITVLP